MCFVLQVTILGSYFDSFNHLLRLLTMLYLTLPYLTVPYFPLMGPMHIPKLTTRTVRLLTLLVAHQEGHLDC